MGGALILARIREATQGTFKLDVQSDQNRKGTLELATTYPGVTLAMLGALTISVTMISSVFNKIESVDAPLYFNPAATISASASQPSNLSAPQVDTTVDGNDDTVEEFLKDIVKED